ncbi:MAG TPA: ThuA domain-containing protein [Humisphaera sp.]
MNRRSLLRSLAAAALAAGIAVIAPGHAPLARAADATPGQTTAAKKLKVLLVTGGCCHDYGKQKQILQQGITARAAGVTIDVVHEGDGKTNHRHSIYEKPDWWKGYDLVIHDECSADVKDVKFIENVLAPHKAGIPGVVLHCGMHNYRSENFPKSTPWFDFTGLPSTGHGPQEPIAITYTDAESPVTKGLAGWTTIKEELYNNVAGGVLPTAKPLARGKQVVKDKKTGKENTVETIVAWTNEYGDKKTKVFATTIGHNNDTVADARYLNLVTRGLLWAAGSLDDQNFKASDANVDVSAIKADPWKDPAKADPKAAPKADAAGKGGIELVRDVPCCGNE